MSIGSAGPNRIAVNTIRMRTYPALRATESVLVTADRPYAVTSLTNWLLQTRVRGDNFFVSTRADLGSMT